MYHWGCIYCCKCNLQVDAQLCIIKDRKVYCQACEVRKGAKNWSEKIGNVVKQNQLKIPLEFSIDFASQCFQFFHATSDFSIDYS